VILRSVVGKLWLTIIMLVSLVLILLSLFLSEQVDKTYVRGEKKSLQLLAQEMQHSLKTDFPDHIAYFRHVLKVSEMFHTYLIVLDQTGNVTSPISDPDQVPAVPWNEVFTKAELAQVLSGQTLSGTARVKVLDREKENRFFFKDDVLYVASPYREQGKTSGVLILYRTQDSLSEADIKRWIFYSALIGIALSTIFAFFLSTRITQPLIQMKKAAEKMAHGQFSTRVPVRAHEQDEIADLAVAFNRMAEQLEDSIHQLSQEKEQLSSILRSMTDGVLTLDKRGNIILTNPPAERFFALCQEKNEKTLPASLQTCFEMVVADDKEHTGDITEQGRTWAVVMAPLYAGDQVRGVVAVLRDVTEERQIDKLRKDFVANISHELRTPLVMLQGYSEALLDEIAETAAERKEIIQVIHEESQRMGRLVRELLHLARMEAGHIQLEPATLSIPDLIQRVLRKFHALARERKMQLVSYLAENLPQVWWDEDKMEQVLINLIDNAIRHTPTGGTVQVRVYEKEQKVYLEVEDTGSGITEEDLPFVFERFYKADKARTRGQSGGTGLGLSIVKNLLHLHGGDISVKSRLGVGTTFIVVLPAGTRSGTDANGNNY
jgi:two-component system, OmpR family, sensor histidine kinase ResE